jgi:NAD(P)-dependent dehydrogenase (short-subunit alcohol dehydrogenase family)
MTEGSSSMRYAQKNVLVTGAGAGLGRHIAKAFAAEGADIAILDSQAAGATAPRSRRLSYRTQAASNQVEWRQRQSRRCAWMSSQSSHVRVGHCRPPMEKAMR